MINYGTPAVKDLYTKGYNPLRCDVCQEKRKAQDKNTCGDSDCVRRYFQARVIPDVSEERILK